MRDTDRYRLYERLARAYHAGIYNYLRWLCRSAELAEDLTQETFLRIWQHLPEYRGERALKAWVYTVARNEYLQFQRKTGILTTALDDQETVAESTAENAQLRLERAETSQAIQAIVDNLPQLYREVIVLHNLESLSLQQVAEVLGIPIGTVKSRRAEAFAILRQSFTAEVKCNEL